ncbi:MAG: hypothetical protein ACKO0V_22160 [bacterium]
MSKTHRNYDPDILRCNLKVLAGFDRAENLSGTGAKKLHFHNDGRFSVDEGKKSAFKRTFSVGASLTDHHNLNSIRYLFEEAIQLLVINGPFESGLRQEIFDALRGFRFLMINGYGSRRQSIENTYRYCLSRFGEVLKEAINGTANFTTVYSGEVMPKVNFRNIEFGQATYIDKDYVEDGICFGISAKWGLRNIMSDKPTITQSSHQLNPQSPKATELSNYRNSLENEVDLILQSPELLEQLNKQIFKDMTGMSFMSRFGNNREAAKTYLMRHYEMKETHNPNRNRLKQKGDEMYAIMHKQNPIKYNKNQDTGFGELKISDAIRSFNNSDQYFKPTTQNLLKMKPAGLGTDQFINNIAAHSDGCRFYRLGSLDLFYGSRPETSKKMYLRDFTYFTENIRYIILNCAADKRFIQGERVKKQRQPVAFSYMITWSAGINEGYGNISQQDGHALGLNYHPSLGDEACLLFDPNYGEFRCDDNNAAIAHLSKWFSLYSKDTNLATASFYRISRSGFHHNF